MKRSSIYLNIGGGPNASYSPSPAEKPTSQDIAVSTNEAQNVHNEPAGSQEGKSDYYVEVIVPRGRESHVSTSGVEQKSFREDNSSPTKEPASHEDITVSTKESQNVQNEPAVEDTVRLQEGKSDYFVEVMVSQGRASHVSTSGVERKSSIEDISSPTKEKKKRKCGFWIWIYLIVVIVIVICVIVLFVLKCNFHKNLRKESDTIRHDMLRVQDKIETDSAKNIKELSDTATNISNMGPLFDDTEFKKIENIMDRVELLTKVIGDWRKSHENLFYKLILKNASYDIAEASCRAMKGHLAAKVLRKAVTQKEVDLFERHSNISKVWVGYHRNLADSKWKWVDGGQTNKHNLKWRDGSEPRNETGYDCAVVATELIQPNKPNVIQSEDCDNPLPYVCEIEPMSIL